ncbi:MAG: hypothetical protein ACE5K3_09490 [bacterium]
MVNRNVREKKHRLPLHCYLGQVRVTFTLCIEDKRPFFVGKVIVDKFIEILREAKDWKEFLPKGSLDFSLEDIIS